MDLSIDQRFELDSLRGRPDGPVQYIEALGMEVPTYVDPRKDLWAKGIDQVLMYHVPLKFRGTYKVRAGETEGPHGEPLNDANFCLCMGLHRLYATNHKKDGKPYLIAKNANKPCKLKAQNYSGYCGWHGGALHPLDKSRPREYSREYLFSIGKLSVQDLDDEELARGQIRKADGTWSNNKNIPREVFQAAQAELFKRADIKLRENLITAVDTMAEIASGSAYEPEVRIRAAQFIYERVRGKNPDIVVHTQDKPFEIMMSDMVMQGGSRAASRAARGIENAIDAEVVDDGSIVVHSDYEHADSGVDLLEDGSAGEEIEVDLVPLRAEVPEHHGPAGAPMTTPPVDPLLRDKWEKERIANEHEVQETVAELAARLKKRRDEARAKRYAARSKGLAYVETHPYTWSNQEEWIDDPSDPGYEMAVNRVVFREPVIARVPAHVKAADTRRIKRMR